MAANTYPLYGKGNFHSRISGSFTPSGAAVSSAAGATRGVDFTPSYVTTGVYRITLADNFKRIVSATFGYQGLTADSDDITIRLGDVNEANKTIDIIVLAAGAKANVTASGVLRRIYFDLELSQSDALGSGTVA